MLSKQVHYSKYTIRQLGELQYKGTNKRGFKTFYLWENGSDNPIDVIRIKDKYISAENYFLLHNIYRWKTN